MKTDDFDFDVPAELIAQYPAEHRGSSRLMCILRQDRKVEHRLFSELPSILRPGDRLVFNTAKVIPARLMCRKENGIGIELLFVDQIDGGHWKALIKPRRRVKAGTQIMVDGSYEKLHVEKLQGDGTAVIAGPVDSDKESIVEILERHGRIPLPPYIKRNDQSLDRERYQTIFAQTPGAVAAPTAGLHFSPELMQELGQRGIECSYACLWVGLGTFSPVKVDNPVDHVMHGEKFELPESTAIEIEKTRSSGGRIIAVGTTVVRILETCAAQSDPLRPFAGSTDLFILPGYRFRMIDGLITNFHTPRSTLLMLVSAFASRELILAAYQQAIDNRYRFFSYGDAMIVL